MCIFVCVCVYVYACLYCYLCHISFSLSQIVLLENFILKEEFSAKRDLQIFLLPLLCTCNIGHLKSHFFSSVIHFYSLSCFNCNRYLYDILTKTIVANKKIPLLILCNKTDKVTAHSKEFIKKQLEKEM